MADGNILVFDWRDPVSTIFYECHDGRASYDVLDRYHYSGDVRLKRQYKIEHSQHKQIVDDYILDQVISRQNRLSWLILCCGNVCLQAQAIN